jgi:hypothetical protein
MSPNFLCGGRAGGAASDWRLDLRPSLASRRVSQRFGFRRLRFFANALLRNGSLDAERIYELVQ